jgi:hypothetical protein
MLCVAFLPYAECHGLQSITADFRAVRAFMRDMRQGKRNGVVLRDIFTFVRATVGLGDARIYGVGKSCVYFDDPLPKAKDWSLLERHVACRTFEKMVLGDGYLEPSPRTSELDAIREAVRMGLIAEDRVEKFFSRVNGCMLFTKAVALRILRCWCAVVLDYDPSPKLVAGIAIHAKPKKGEPMRVDVRLRKWTSRREFVHVFKSIADPEVQGRVENIRTTSASIAMLFASQCPLVKLFVTPPMPDELVVPTMETPEEVLECPGDLSLAAFLRML